MDPSRRALNRLQYGDLTETLLLMQMVRFEVVITNAKIVMSLLSYLFQLLTSGGECTLQWNIPTLPRTSMQYLTQVASDTCLCVL